jgi:hypothetical protein
LSRISLAFSAFFGLLFGGSLPDSVIAALGLSKRGASKAASPAAAPAPAAPVYSSDAALQILGILQRDARLLDFLMEDISPYTDDQIGAAVRDIHANSRAALQRYTTLEPVIDGVEGAVTQLTAAGPLKNDPAAIKLLGNVPADGSAKAGVLRHKGWKVSKLDLPTPAAKANLKILAPAEIEVE